MRINIKYLLFTLFLVCSLPVSGDGIKRGLYFRSFEVDKDKRTCLDLTPTQPLVFNKDFTLEFDINLRLESQTFGYVFRIIGNDTLNVDFLANIATSDANFSLVIKNKALIHFKKQEINSDVANMWIKALFVFDPAGNTISVSLGDVKKEATYPLNGLNHFKGYFGGNTHGVFSTTDIAPMMVKDIRLFDGKKLVRHWELAKYFFGCVYDECISDKATVQNPVWEIDRHAKWNKKETLVYAGLNHQIAFDRKGDRVYFAKDKTLFVYDFVEQKTDTIEVLAGIPFNNVCSNQLIYDPNRHVLISYDFDGRRLAVFDFSTRKWSNDDNSLVIQRYSHHERLFIEGDSMLVTFGGYGYHRYNSMFYKCHVVENIWEATNLSQSIPPRYLGSMGRLEGKTVLYFGGFGNESGIQEEFPRNFYDLYTIDIDRKTVKKIWELLSPKEHFTNSNSLVVDKRNRKFYALAYPNKRYASVIKLHEYNIDKPEYQAVGDSIPYFFDDVESYCDLFQSSDSSELYAVISYGRGNSSDINIYTMAFPPLSPEEIVQHPPLRSNTWLWIIVLVLLVSLSFVYVIYRKKRNRLLDSSGNTIEQIPGNDEEPIVYESLLAEKKPSSIYLLGNFQVIDSDGNDITKNFTPTTTHLFLLLLMSTVRNGRGITSNELRKTLWFDKDDDSARNNRNVYINKLRSILKSFREIKVVNHEGYWTIQSEKNVFCDFERVQVLMKMLQNGDRFNIKLLTELVDIALTGTLLPYLQPEWLEPYQTEYTNQLIEGLMSHSKRDEVKTDLLLLLKIADVIFLHDNIDEDAIKLKCYALFRSGRKNQAIHAFNKFTVDYENLLATKHNLTFDDLVKSV